ncbi:hypothetical protein R5R35_006881 [Gryllus longicercus]|uniref:Uncharacterized protein n=1 Tax=Gryllus longicercus TaxID=2509291 RepID=A0AAN9VRW5_9ORTH
MEDVVNQITLLAARTAAEKNALAVVSLPQAVTPVSTDSNANIKDGLDLCQVDDVTCKRILHINDTAAAPSVGY